MFESENRGGLDRMDLRNWGEKTEELRSQPPVVRSVKPPSADVGTKRSFFTEKPNPTLLEISAKARKVAGSGVSETDDIEGAMIELTAAQRGLILGDGFERIQWATQPTKKIIAARDVLEAEMRAINPLRWKRRGELNARVLRLNDILLGRRKEQQPRRVQEIPEAK